MLQKLRSNPFLFCVIPLLLGIQWRVLVSFWRRFYSHVLSQDHVDEILCGDDGHAFPKPDPRNIQYICDTLDIPPEETVMVGDSKGTFLFDLKRKTVSNLLASASEDCHNVLWPEILCKDFSHQCVVRWRAALANA